MPTDRQPIHSRDKLKLILRDEDADPKSLSFRLLLDITDNFSDHLQIGTGGSAEVYKGILGSSTVAVKKLYVPHKHEKEFLREIECLQKVKHKNVLRCLGYCYSVEGHMAKYKGKLIMQDKQERLFCFPYLAKGSLDKYITDASSGLEWSQRYQIINGICQGLHQIHQDGFIHLDLKPENILLDDDMVPKISDFGLSRCLDENQSKPIRSESRGGSFGFLAPEYIYKGIMTNKCDLYSLGVIIMKILSGEEFIVDEFKVLDSWMKRWGQLRTSAQLEQIKECARIGIECINDNSDNRPPDMKHIIDRLEKTTSTRETQNSLKILDVQPIVLLFDYSEARRGRLVPCSLQLRNDTDEHMAFLLRTTESVVGWSEHFTRRYGIVPARSVYTLILTVLVLEKVPDKRSCDMILQSCTSVHDHIWKFNNEHECDKFFEDKKKENAVNMVNLTAFLCPEGHSTPSSEHVRISSIEGQQTSLLSIDAHPTKPWIITGHDLGHIRIRNHETQELLDSFKVSQGPVSCVKFIAWKPWFICSSAEGVIHVYSYEPETQKVASFKAHAAGPISLAVHPSQPYVLSSSPCSGSHEKKLWEWDKEWRCIQTFEMEHYEESDFLCQLAFDLKETNQFASVSNDIVKVWSLDSSKPKYRLPGQFNQVNFLEFFTRDDNQYLIIIGIIDTAPKIWDMQKKEYVSNKNLQSSLSPVPPLLTGSYYGTSRFWSAKDFRLRVIDYGSGGNVRGIACLMRPNKRFAIGQEAALITLDIDNATCQEDSSEYHEPRLCADTRAKGTSSEVIKQGPSELLHVHQKTLHFTFKSRSLIPCSLHLTNTTDKDVAFMLNSAEEDVDLCQDIFPSLPLSGIVPSKSTYTLVLTTSSLQKLPRQKKINLVLQSNISGDRYIYTLTAEECGVFFEDAKVTGRNAVHKVKLEAVFALQEQTTSSGHDSIQPSINMWVEHSDKDFSNNTLSSLDADPEDSWIITGHSHGDVFIWKHGTKKMMSSINTSEEAGRDQSFSDTQRDVYSVKFIARKRWFVAATYDGFIHVYKYGTTMDFIKKFKAHSYGNRHSSNYLFRALVVHPTLPCLLSTFEGMKLWNWEKDWHCEQTFLREGSDSICQVAFSSKHPDTFASASSDHTVKLWNLHSPKSVNTLGGHSNQVNCLDFFKRDGREYLISGSDDCTAKIWDLEEKKCVRTIEVFKSPVVSVISLPHTPYIATGSGDGTVHLWNSSSYRLERILSVGFCFPVRSLCLIGPTRVVIEQLVGVSVMHIFTFPEAGPSALSKELIKVDPQELRFPVSRQVSRTLEIRNITDHDYVAFWIWSLNHTAIYIPVPQIEVLSPGKTWQVNVTRIKEDWMPTESSTNEDIVYVKGTVVVQGTRSTDVDVSYMFDETKPGRIVQVEELNVVPVASEIIPEARSSLPWALDVHTTMPLILMTQGDYHVRIRNYKTQENKSIAIKGRQVTSAKFIAHKQWIMAGCSSGLIYVYGYDPEKKNPVKKIQVLRGHSKAVNSLAVHATATCVLSASEDGKIFIWDYENENKWKKKPIDVESPVRYVSFSPKDTNMFASAQGKTVQIWDYWHPDNCKRTLSGHSDLVLCLDYFSQGDMLYLITGAQDKLAKIWDCKDGRCVQTLEGHSDVVNVACHHPDPLILITGSLNGSVRLWHWSPRSTTFRYELNFDLGEVYAIASLKGSTRIAIGNEFGLALVDIDLDSKKHGDANSTVAIMDSENEADQNRKELNPSTSSSGEEQKTASNVAYENIDKVKSAYSIDVHPTEPWMVITTDKFVHIWDYQTKKVKLMMDTKGVKVTLAKFIAHKQWVIAGATSGFIFVYDYDSKKQIIHVLCDHTESIKSLAVHGTEPLVLSASMDGKILLWDYSNDWHLITTFDAKSGGLAQVAFNPKEANMFASAQGKTVKIWDRWHDQWQHTLDGHSQQIVCFDYFVGGDFDKLHIITGSRDKTAKIWDCENASCVQTLEGHAGPVTAVCYHRNLSLLITGCSDGSFRLWNSTTFELENELNFDIFGSLSIACLKGSKRIVIRSKKGLALVDMDIEDKTDGNEESIVTTDSMNNTGPIKDEV